MPGEMAEWSIAAVLKTVELRGSGGSNPSLSATRKDFTESCDLSQLFCIEDGHLQIYLRVPFFNRKVPWQATLGKIFSCNLRSTGIGDRREPIPLTTVFEYRLLARLMKIEA